MSGEQSYNRLKKQYDKKLAEIKNLKLQLNKERLKIKEVGIKDINNKKIYADSSIVEFDYFDLNLKGEECNKNTYKGYFSWHIDTLSYFIHYDCGNEIFNQVQYCPSKFKNFKIIDTIQENKLGLIK